MEANSLNENSKKLFIAIEIPSPELLALTQAIKKLKIGADKKKMDFKWVPPQNHHVTVKFLGDVENHKIPEISHRLQDIAENTSSFDLKLSGLGCFPDNMHTRVIWVGVQAKSNLRQLASQLDSTLAGLGYGERDIGFVPHMTIGRLRKQRNCTDLISPFVRNKFGKIRVKTIVLYESILQNQNPIYSKISEFRLSAVE